MAGRKRYAKRKVDKFYECEEVLCADDDFYDSWTMFPTDIMAAEV